MSSIYAALSASMLYTSIMLAFTYQPTSDMRQINKRLFALLFFLQSIAIAMLSLTSHPNSGIGIDVLRPYIVSVRFGMLVASVLVNVFLTVSYLSVERKRKFKRMIKWQ